ncbi:putative glycerophosphocholine phosphodiesterase GPCPD1 [Dirofilaria immitis]
MGKKVEIRFAQTEIEFFRCQALVAQMSIAPRIILHFSVEVETVRPWEYVFVTGSMPALGSWMPSDAFLLYPDPDSARQRWEGAVEVESDPVKFRYFIGYYLNSGKEEEKNELVVSKWESFLHPRSVLPTVESISGVCHLHVTDKFGWNSGKNLVSEASLVGQNQNEILLRFHGNPFKFYKKRYSERSYCIKVTPFDLRHKEAGSIDDDDNEESQDLTQPVVPSYSVAHIAILP